MRDEGRREADLVVLGGVGLLALTWGSTWLAIKIGLQQAPPLSCAAPRFLLAAAALGVVAVLRGAKLPRTRAWWRRAGVLALLMYVVPYGLVYWGEQHVSSGLAAVVFSTHSLFVVGFAHVLLAGEPATPGKLAGILVGLVGLGMLFSDQLALDGPMGIAGMGAVVVAAASGALALVWLRRAPAEVDPVPEVAVQLGITGVVFLLLAATLERGQGDWASPSLWLAISYLAIPGTAVAFVVYYALIKRASAVAVSFSIFAAPVFAVALGWLVLGERLGPGGLIGTGLVLAGIVATQARARRGGRPASTTMREHS